MHYTVYKIVNKINGKVYVGKHQTKDLNDGYMGSGKLLHRAYEKYGAENFSKAILFDFDNEELMNAKERELVTEEFCLREDTYNICVGGQGGFSYINREGLCDKSAAAKKSAIVIANMRLQNPERFYHINRLLGVQNIKDRAAGKLYCFTNADRQKAKKALSSPTIKEKRKASFIKNGHSQGEKNSQFGSMWITNDKENKKIKNLDHMPSGWRKGRAQPKYPKRGY